MRLAAVVVLLVVFAARMVDTAREKTFTLDEPHYLGTGLYLWATGDYHFARSLRFHPPLAFHLASLLLLGIDRPEPLTPAVGGDLIRGGAEDVERIRLLSRVPFIAVACWGGLLVYLFGATLGGGAAGLTGLVLYTSSPLVLGYGPLAHSDLLVSVLFLQTAFAFWWWRHRGRSEVAFAATGVSLGLALAAKATGLLLLPALGGLLLWDRCTGQPVARRHRISAGRLVEVVGRLGFLVALALGMLWLAYGGSFAVSGGLPGPYEDLRLPGYLHALAFDAAANAQGRPIYFAGKVVERGQWYHLPVAYVLKASPGMLLLLLLAAGLLLVRRAPAIPELLVPAAIHLAVALFWLEVPLGVRYLLPALPLLLVTTAVAVTRRPRWRLVAGAAALFVVADAIAAHPHYLAHGNELAGGSAGLRRYVAESNLDWGQDAKTLARFLARQGNPPVALAFVGPEPPSRYGARTTPLVGCDAVPGWVAISVNVHVGLYDPSNPFRRPPRGCYRWLAHRRLAGQPGYSVLVFAPDSEGGARHALPGAPPR